MRLRVDEVNTFLTATLETLEAQCRKLGRLQVGDLRYVEDRRSAHEVSAFSFLRGSVSGKVVLGLPIEMAMAIAEQMLDSPVDHFDEVAQSGVVELLSMIVGRAAMELQERGLPTQMTLSKMSYGTPEATHCQDNPQPLTIPIASDLGECELHLALDLREAS